ncbi:biotin/lipoyl-containing protein, partial [Bosea sp. (in: a-proteobacteria)]
MAERIVKLPDVGEGIAEAELVEWHVKVGDIIREDDLLAAVMTDKATVEIPAPVDGKVTWIGAEIGDTVAIGSALVRLEVAGEGGAVDAPAEDVELEGLPPAEAPTPPARAPRQPETAEEP